MSVVSDMRDRLAAALMVELRNRDLPSGADIAFAVADRALEGTQFEALTEYIGAVEAGEDPADARGKLINDGGFTDMIVVTP